MIVTARASLATLYLPFCSALRLRSARRTPDLRAHRHSANLRRSHRQARTTRCSLRSPVGHTCVSSHRRVRRGGHIGRSMSGQRVMIVTDSDLSDQLGACSLERSCPSSRGRKRPLAGKDRRDSCPAAQLDGTPNTWALWEHSHRIVGRVPLGGPVSAPGSSRMRVSPRDARKLVRARTCSSGVRGSLRAPPSSHCTWLARNFNNSS